LEDPEGFEDTVIKEVRHSIDKMKENTNRWDLQKRSIIFCAIRLESRAVGYYDKKYQLLDPTSGTPCRFMPLFPIVVQAYREVMWHDIMAHVSENEGSLLNVCRMGLGNSAIGQIYEHMVIQRIISNGLTFPWESFDIQIDPDGQNHFEIFTGCDLPPLPLKDGIWIPRNSNFTAINFFLKCEETLIGVQVHVSKHPDVTPNFFKMCNDAGWFDFNKEIGLAYLGPADASMDDVEANVTPMVYTQDKKPRKGRDVRRKIRRIALDSASISSLSTIAW
jgi:hypothetical protein